MLFLLALGDCPDDAAFLENIYHTHYRLLYGQALRVLRNSADAEDTVQNVMLKLADKLDTLRALERNKLPAYLVITVRNTAINLYRQNKARAERRAALNEETAADASAAPEAAALDRDAVDELKALIARLPDRERDAMVLRYVHGLSDREVAAALGVLPVSARSLLARGRKRLKGLLDERRG